MSEFPTSASQGGGAFSRLFRAHGETIFKVVVGLAIAYGLLYACVLQYIPDHDAMRQACIEQLDAGDDLISASEPREWDLTTDEMQEIGASEAFRVTLEYDAGLGVQTVDCVAISRQEGIQTYID